MGDADGEGLEWLSDYIITVLKSPTWVAPIAQFVDERCGVFDDAEENKLEYTTCHNEFKALVDTLLLAHLLDVAVTAEQFDAFCHRGLGGKDRNLHRIFVEQLLGVEDFLTFKAMMVKRNADLDKKAALELARSWGQGGQENQAASVAPGAADAALSLVHSSGSIGFYQWPMTEGVLAWYDREYTYTGVPDECVDALLFSGPHKSIPEGTLSLTSPIAATLYLFHENAGQKRDGGFAQCLRSMPEWVKVGGTHMKWMRPDGRGCWLCVWSRKVAAGEPIVLEVRSTWVGGLALKQDNGEWRLYEEQEQVLQPPSKEGALDGDMAEVAEDAQRRMEEADLEQAIALSLQVEEERIRALEQSGVPSNVEVPVAAPPAEPVLAIAPAEEDSLEPPAAVAPSYTADVSAEVEAPIASPMPATDLAASVAPGPAAEVAPVALVAPSIEAPPAEVPAAAPVLEAPVVAAPVVEAPVAATVQVEAQPRESKPVMPRMVKLQPLSAPSVGPIAAPAPFGTGMTLEQMRAEAILKREAAEKVVMAKPSAASSQLEPTAVPAAAPLPQPTEDERRQRAEHLKRQRDLLVKKRAEERKEQLENYQRAQAGTGRGAVALDQAIGCVTSRAPDQSGLPAGALANQAVQNAGPDGAEAAKAMRQALTLQLRQTLAGTVGGDTTTQLTQLDQLKHQR